MAISTDSMDFLFDTLNFYEEQYSEIAKSCYDDVYKALNEIVERNFSQTATILRYGSYYLGSNYQVFEPMEFIVALKANKSEVLAKENELAKVKKKKKSNLNAIKEIYSNTISDDKTLTASQVASKIMAEMQQYLGEKDVVYFKDNVVFVRFQTQEEITILATITIAYNFEENGIYEFKKYGFSVAENCALITDNIAKKNKETDGNYLVLCKLVKMLELELIINSLSTRYLSKKSLFIESILYNVPNSIIAGNNYTNIFTNVVNYLKNCDINKLVLPDNETKLLTDNKYYAKSMFDSFVRKLIYLNQNTDQMIIDAIEAHEKQMAGNETDNESVEKPKNVKKLGK
jgi:hypothetical protein